jgi:hypothetical protein
LSGSIPPLANLELFLPHSVCSNYRDEKEEQGNEEERRNEEEEFLLSSEDQVFQFSERLKLDKAEFCAHDDGIEETSLEGEHEENELAGDQSDEGDKEDIKTRKEEEITKEGPYLRLQKRLHDYLAEAIERLLSEASVEGQLTKFQSKTDTFDILTDSFSDYYESVLRLVERVCQERSIISFPFSTRPRVKITNNSP